MTTVRSRLHDKMHAMGLEQVPSIASLARIVREAALFVEAITGKPHKPTIQGKNYLD